MNSIYLIFIPRELKLDTKKENGNLPSREESQEDILQEK